MTNGIKGTTNERGSITFQTGVRLSPVDAGKTQWVVKVDGQTVYGPASRKECQRHYEECQGVY